MSRIWGIFSADAEEAVKLMSQGMRKGNVHLGGTIKTMRADKHLQMAASAFGTEAGAAEEKGVFAAIDGVIYNRFELGNFQDDLSCLIDLYTRLGFEGCLRKMNGDFSIALYDPSKKRIFLARDRLGVKPLYYARLGERFAFASRPAGLLAVPWIPNEINERFAAVFAASHYRYFDNQIEESPYQMIAQLPAAHWLSFEDGQIKVGSYWKFEDHGDANSSQESLAREYRDLLIDAVRIRTRHARKPAYTLSGGMDSSSVLASAVYASGQKQHAFSTVYSDKTFDETDEIRSMLDHSVEKWHAVRVDSPDVFSLVRRMVAAHDEPVATATWLAHFVLCEQAAKEGFTSLFGGLGGDELNAGEYEHFFYHFADLRARQQNETLEKEIQKWVEYHNHPIYQKNAEVARRMMDRCADPVQVGRCLPDVDRMKRYFKTLNPDYYDLSRFQPVMDAPFKSYLKTRTYQDLTRETAPCCLRAEDRQTTAFGLENHVPFFDYRLVELMFRTPGEMKVKDGVTKILLREAMRGILPEETRTRVKKTGWNAPAHIWFSGKGREPLMDMIRSKTFRDRGLYNVDEVERLAQEHETIVSSGLVGENHMMFFWQLVNLETWLQALAEKKQ